MVVALKKRLGEILVQKLVLSREKLEKALQVQTETREKIGEVLIKLGYITRESLLEVLSAELDIPVIHLSRYKIEPDVVAMIPRKIAELYGLIPITRFTNTLTVAVSDPMNVNALDDLERLTHMEIRLLIASEKDVREAIDQYYGENVSQAIKDVIEGMTTEERLAVEDASAQLSEESSAQELLRLTQDEPVVKLTNSILSESVRRVSSDIFIEPEEKNLRVRFRVDGVLQEGISTSIGMHAGVVSRIKVMSNLNIAEHRVPQDGRFKVKIQNREIDFRVSVIPAYFGEKVVLRVLDKSQVILDIEKLGFEPEPLRDLKKMAGNPNGMIITCGPTGSGKTTTLYSLLKFIDRSDINLVTVEDPVEYQIEGVNQVAVRPEVKLTFARALRSILRQDPDVIMVGEIRDSETADIAIKAALTGHLVLSTLHTNTAVGAITRLANMGIEPFLITSSVLLSASQRLVRRICSRCKESYEPSQELLRQLDITEKELRAYKGVFFRGKGCQACAKKGYSGRIVLMEALCLTTKVKELILKGAPEEDIKTLGRAEGMKTLRESGIAKILQGVTTPEEVIRVTVRD